MIGLLKFTPVLPLPERRNWWRADGVDILWLPREGVNGVYAYYGGDFGSNPISFWKKHRGPGRSVSVGAVFGINSAADWSEGSATATWPVSVLARLGAIARKLGPTAHKGVLGLIERMAYYNNRKQLFGVAQVGFSTSGPGFVRWGFASNAFTWEMGDLSPPIKLGEGISSMFNGLTFKNVMDNPTLLGDRAAALSQ